jgi:tripartite-type tricarboxylate transporter receptor subunit TctC
MFIGTKLGAIVLAAALVAPANAQEFPTKPIRILIGFAPGSIADIPARNVLAPEMSKALGQPVVVENRPGAAGLIAYEFVAKQAPADGHTLVWSTASMPTLPLFVKDVSFDPVRDLPPVSILMRFRTLLTSPAAAPWRDFAGMVAYAKANPGKINLGASSQGGPLGLLTESMKQKFSIDIVTILYGGTAQQRTAMLGNEVQLGYLGENAVEDVRGNLLKVIAVTGNRRLAAVPDAPTFNEVGMANVDDLWMGLHVRGGTPQPIVDKLYAAVAAALKQPAAVEQMAKIGMEIVAATPEASGQEVRRMAESAAQIAKAAGIKPQ